MPARSPMRRANSAASSACVGVAMTMIRETPESIELFAGPGSGADSEDHARRICIIDEIHQSISGVAMTRVILTLVMRRNSARRH